MIAPPVDAVLTLEGAKLEPPAIETAAVQPPAAKADAPAPADSPLGVKASAERIRERLILALSAVEKLPALESQRDAVYGAIQEVHGAYSEACRAARVVWTDSLSPLTEELSSIEAEIESAIAAKALIESLANVDSKGV